MGETTPYYDDGSCVIYHADCLDVLPTLRDVGLIVTSPPYNLNRGLDDVPVESMHDRRSGSRSGRAANRLTDSYSCHDDAMPQADYMAWQRAVLSACWSVLRDDGAIYYNHKPRSQAGRYRHPLVFVPEHVTLRQVVIWNRVEKGQAYTANAYVPACEWLLVLARDGFRLKGREASALSDVWTIHPERNGRGHPCPFPLGLPARVLATAACNGTVVDPFMGSGTTLRAAKDVGVRAVGVDIDERYCEIAAQRLAQEALL
jgi:modification methylase